MNNLINIITPYKSNSIDLLDKTVETLAYQNIQDINHIIICDQSCNRIVDSYFKEIKCDFTSNYKFVILEATKKGIYSAINVGLNFVRNDSLYLVLGAGDLIFINKNHVFNMNNDIFIIPYSEYDSRDKIYTKMRSLYSGIPFCHNAIIFKKNKIRYNEKFKISSDYLYFIEYLKSKKFLSKLKIELVDSFKVLVETKNGISSKNRLLKNFENLKIVSYFFSFKGITFYLFFVVVRLINMFLKKITHKLIFW